MLTHPIIFENRDRESASRTNRQTHVTAQKSSYPDPEPYSVLERGPYCCVRGAHKKAPRICPSPDLAVGWTSFATFSVARVSTASHFMSFFELLKFDVTSNLTTAVAVAMSVPPGPIVLGGARWRDIVVIVRLGGRRVDVTTRSGSGTIAVRETALMRMRVISDVLSHWVRTVSGTLKANFRDLHRNVHISHLV